MNIKKKKQNGDYNETDPKHINEDIKNTDEENDEEDKKKNKKNEGESVETFEDLENLKPDEIQIVKKHKKIFVKRNDRNDPIKDTVAEDILLPIQFQEDEYKEHYVHENDHHHNNKHPEHKNKAVKEKRKTKLRPYDIMKEVVINEQLLEGKVEKEEEEKKDDEEGKPKEVEKKKEEGEEEVKENKADDDDEVNPYLEKFKYQYLSDIITTGTVSIVIKTDNIESMMNIQNP